MQGNVVSNCTHSFSLFTAHFNYSRSFSRFLDAFVTSALFSIERFTSLVHWCCSHLFTTPVIIRSRYLFILGYSTLSCDLSLHHRFSSSGVQYMVVHFGSYSWILGSSSLFTGVVYSQVVSSCHTGYLTLYS